MRVPAAETVFWFCGFWIVLPALAYNGWGGWPADGWLGVALLVLVVYPIAIVGVNLTMNALLREVWRR
jgi:hypothetical protein